MEEGIPIYLQIVRYVERCMVSQVAKDGEELPSRRTLSALLGVNPNTVQKAYRLMEEAHYMESKSGTKSILTISPELVATVRQKLLYGDIMKLIDALKASGSTKEEALSLIADLWSKEVEPV